MESVVQRSAPVSIGGNHPVGSSGNGAAVAAADAAAGSSGDGLANWVNSLPLPTAPAAAASGASASSAGAAPPQGITLGRLGEALARQALADTAAASARSTAQHSAPGTRRNLPHREWLGPLPPSALAGVQGQVDYHWGAHPVQAVPPHNGLAEGAQVAGLEVQGVGIRPGREAARMAQHNELRMREVEYGVPVRCPICRSAVEQSVSDVLIV